MREILDKLSEELSLVLIEKKELEKKEKELKDKIMQEMESSDILTIDNRYVKVTYVLPQTRISLDTTKLKKMDSNLYDELTSSYSKKTTTKPSLRVTLHG